MRIVSGHQPVYLPWLGLIHKASLADVFVFMDDVQYLEKDWNNRNRIKTPQGKAIWLTVPVDLSNSKTRLLKDIRISREVHLSEKDKWQVIHWQTVRMAYSRAPYFNRYKDFFEWLYCDNRWEYLSELNLTILKKVFEWFDINTEIIIGSRENFAGKKSDLVLEHGIRYKADIVVTGALGRDYIEEDRFRERAINVIYQEYRHPVYRQSFGEFVSHLSFIDLLFNYGSGSRQICLENNISREALCQSVLN